MSDEFKGFISLHLREHAGIYFFLFVLFGVGVAFGALAVGALEDNQRLELVHYLKHFLGAVRGEGEGAPAARHVFSLAFGSNLRTTGLIFLLGLSIAGVPLVPVVIFLRGFILGFTVGFLLSQLGWPGFGMVFLAVLPQNLILVPFLLILAASALAFGGAVVLRHRGGKPWPAALQLIVLAVAALAAASAASLIEGYVAPLFLRILARW